MAAMPNALCPMLMLLAALGCVRPAGAGASDVGAGNETERIRALVSVDEHARKKAVASYCNDGMAPSNAAYYPCVLNRFQSSGDARQFLEQIPSDPASLATLWAVDETVMKGIASPAEFPKPMGASNFLSAFLNALAVSAGSQAAESVDRLLVLQDHADGWMAELVEQSNLDLFAARPALLVENWTVVEKYRSRVGFGSTDFEDRRTSIERTVTDYCSSRGLPEDDCARVLKFLAQS